MAIRAFLPQAQTGRAVAMDLSENQLMTRIRLEGFFEVLFPGCSQLLRYRLQVADASGYVREFDDPYSFWPILSDFDLHQGGEEIPCQGRHHSIRVTLPPLAVLYFRGERQGRED